MKKKIIGSCLILLFLLTACGKKEEAEKEASESSSTNETTQQSAAKIEDLRDGTNFTDFDGETQLAIVFATLNDIVVAYDYGVGGAEAQLKTEMTPESISNMKESVDSMAAQQEKLRQESTEVLGRLDIFKEKAKTEEEVALLKQAQEELADVSQQILEVLAQVTPENAAMSRTTVDALKEQYLAKSEGIMTAMKKIVQVAGLDEEKFMNLTIYIIDHVAKE
ncbi:hypothetical protein [Isobaculum melis]|uniref:Cell-wall binding lipoprotein n=1 Tax=Isobaculum melis TaxID=142588 RepID=A0A1H9U024_9LACT|nr:hypothetical protein [Isobaculum melis]SES02796.1 hypothetical protein SAMN04488559_11913 [Isobaculum melis]